MTNHPLSSYTKAHSGNAPAIIVGITNYFKSRINFDIKTLFFILLLNFSVCLSAQTKVVRKGEHYSFYRNGAPYYVKGLGGDVNLDRVVAIGGNSIRIWGVENAQQVLDEAQKRGLTVMLGLWLQHERHGFNYSDSEKVLKQLNYFKTIIDKYKNHPALLMWGIGNELDLNYTNTKCWNAVQDIAKYAHAVDPNHPTSTVTAGLDSSEVQLIKKNAPDVDVYCVNTYGDIANVPLNIAKFGWDGPYMITEWGPNGYWESPNTTWKAAIEQTSAEKKRVFYDRYKNYIDANKEKCLGSYAFLWGMKQEYTETWFGLFTKDNLPTEPIDALEMVFTGKNPTLPAPTVVSMTLNNSSDKKDIRLKAEEIYKADVVAEIGVNMDNLVEDSNHAFVYTWKVLSESSDKKSGGDAEEEAQEIHGLIKHGSRSAIELRAPKVEGAYRIFVKVTSNGKVAYANIPFWVEKRAEQDGQARWIEFKKKDMRSFNEQ